MISDLSSIKDSIKKNGYLRFFAVSFLYMLVVFFSMYSNGLVNQWDGIWEYNYYKAGPSTKASVRTRIVDPWTSCENCISACGGQVVPPVIYLTGNTMENAADISADNWKGSTKSKSVAGTDNRWTEGMTLLASEQNASQALQTVLAKSGCSLSRDAVDERIVQEVQQTTGKLIDSPEDVGGWPELKGNESAITDEDEDHIPDEWEKKYGLDPTNRKDARAQTLVSGLTNYEVYLNDLVKNLY